MKLKEIAFSKTSIRKLIYMKFLILILLFISVNLLGQTFHGIDAGFDSTAYSNHIKSKSVTTYTIDSLYRDTVWTEKYDYLENGYVKRYQEVNIKYFDESSSWNLGYHFIEFEYNDKGYLIDIKDQWDGPTNFSGAIDSMRITTTKIFKNEKLFKEIIFSSQWFSDFDIYTDTIIKMYNLNGQLSEVSSSSDFRQTYYYNEKQLLTKIEFSNSQDVFKIEEYKYEFFEK